MTSYTSNFGIDANCCPTGSEYSDIYGCLPTGMVPGNLQGETQTPDLWETMFNGSDSWWNSTTGQWANPYNAAEAMPRNCIDFRNRCPRKDRIALTLPGDCCADICASATEDLDILNTVPKAESKTVTVMARKGMCPGSVSPPVPLEGLWKVTVTLADSGLIASDVYRFQASRNGHSWVTFPSDYVDDPGFLYDAIFDRANAPCPTSCLCLANTPDAADPTQTAFPDTNAFWGTTAINGQPRQPCDPLYCYLRIVALGTFCVESFTATYASGTGLCSIFPTCPTAMVYEDRICRPLPKAGCPGLPAPQVRSWTDPTNPGGTVVPPAISLDATENRRLLSITKQIRKQHPGGQSESQHTRNVRAVAGPPWNSRATTDNGQGILLTNCGNADCTGYACPMCTKTLACQCGVGCYSNGDPYPNATGCSNPAFCRRRYARKHQYDGRMLDELVACAVAGCRRTCSAGTGSGGSGGGTAPAALTAMMNKGWSNTDGSSGCVATNTGAPISFNGKFWVWLYEPGTPTVLFNALSYDGTTWEWYNFTSGTSPALSDLTGTALDTSTSTGNTIVFSTAGVTFTINGAGCTFQGSGSVPWPVPA